MEYELEELTKEEAEALTFDLQEVLKKHNCELGVKSSINLMKRKETGIPSPLSREDLNGDNPTKEKAKID